MGDLESPQQNATHYVAFFRNRLGLLPPSPRETRGVERFPGARLPAWRRESEQDRGGGGLKWRLETNVAMADSRGTSPALLWWTIMGDRACTFKPHRGFGKKKGKERKGIHGKSEQGFLSFLIVQTVDFMLRSATDIKGCFTARRSRSQPSKGKPGEHQIHLAGSSFNPDVWQRGDKTSDTSLLCRLNLRIYKRSSFTFSTVSHTPLAVWY